MGDTAYLAGQIGLDPSTGKLVSGGLAAEIERTLDNIEAVLKGAELKLSDVARVTVYLTDMSDAPAMNEVYMRRFGKCRPAYLRCSNSSQVFGWTLQYTFESRESMTKNIASWIVIGRILGALAVLLGLLSTNTILNATHEYLPPPEAYPKIFIVLGGCILVLSSRLSRLYETLVDLEVKTGTVSTVTQGSSDSRKTLRDVLILLVTMIVVMFSLLYFRG
jgi:enamine deaminase RidA (YjgF/YER057c/UK114 family)